MKIRNNFVSNSSSSSFILALSQKPQNVDEMQRLLFADDKTFPSTYGDEEYDVRDISQIVLDKIGKSSELSIEQIAEYIANGYFDGIISEDMLHSICKLRDGTTDWDAYDKAKRSMSLDEAKAFAKRWAGKVFVCLEISDDTRIGNDMEHGDLFARIPHLTISNH